MSLKTETATGLAARRSEKNAAPSKVRKPNMNHKMTLMAMPRFRPIWSDDRRHFQGWELA